MERYIKEILNALSDLDCINRSCHFNPPRVGTSGPCTCLNDLPDDLKRPLLMIWQHYKAGKGAFSKCDFCSPDEDSCLFYGDDYGRIVEVRIGLEQELAFYAQVEGEEVEVGFEIEFCPMCGRKLVE